MADSFIFEYLAEGSLDFGTKVVLVPDWNREIDRLAVPKWVLVF